MSAKRTRVYSNRWPGDLFEGRQRQLLLAAAGTFLMSIVWITIPVGYLPLAISALFLGVLIAVRSPFVIMAGLLLFAAFKIDNVFTFLLPGRFPLLFSTLASVALIWHVFLTRSVAGEWNSELRLLVLFFFIATIGLAFSKSRPIAIDAWWEYAKLFFLVLALAWFPRSPSHFKAAACLLPFCGFLIAGAAIHNNFIGEGLVEGTRVTVATENFSNPNDLAVFLLLPLSLAASLVVRYCSPAAFMIGLVAAPTILWGVVLTQSRAGLLGVISIAAVLCFDKFRSKAIVCVLLCAVALALYLAMGLSSREQGGVADAAQESAMGRIYAWQAATKMALSWPTGVGIGNFENEYFQFTPVWLGRTFTAHSTWFQVLGELGVIGLLVFMAMMIRIFASSIRNVRDLAYGNPPPLLQATALGVCAGIAGIIVAGSFGTYAYTWPLYVAMALTAAISRWVRDSRLISAA